MRADISALTRACIALIPVFQAERCRRRITAVPGGRNEKEEAAFALLPLKKTSFRLNYLPK